jgi:hypothetical protein
MLPLDGRRACPRTDDAQCHRGEVLGEATYESLARKGETMTTAAITAYAYDQIDQARIELNAVLNQTTYERLETSCRRWRGDTTDIVGQR